MIPGTCGAQSKPELLVAAAADLTDCQISLSQAFQRATGEKVLFTIGASGMLARQIEQGAPYDVFLSANESFVTELARTGKVEPGSVRVYALGRLGLWSRSGALRTLAELRNAQVLHLAIANPVHAPYGAAAKELLQREGLWKDLEPKVVYGENVRQALQFAESGNADAVITSWSLLFDRTGAVELPDTHHSPIRQAAAVVAGRPNVAAARKFLDFLGSAEGKRILQAHGLSVK